LTTETDEQAEVRAADKGRDCAQCAVEMANLVAALEPEADEDEEDEDLEQSDARR
jgi:6,7-dimethyl-8-ribityllumazine synthase